MALDPAVIRRYLDDARTSTAPDEQAKIHEEMLFYLLGLVPGVRVMPAKSLFPAELVGIAVGHARELSGLTLADRFLLTCEYSKPLGSSTVEGFRDVLARRRMKVGVMIAAFGVTSDPVDLAKVRTLGAEAWEQEISLMVISTEEILALRTLPEFVELLELRALRPTLEDIGLPNPEDLATLARRPTPSVARALPWDRLSSEDFERLLYTLMEQAEGYERVQYLTEHKAADGGRDISAERWMRDSLGLARPCRVVVQAKHHLGHSLGAVPVNAIINEAMALRPRFSLLVIATTGMFSDAGVRAVEAHNEEDRRLEVEMWPRSHLETLLARHPHIAGSFGLA